MRFLRTSFQGTIIAVMLRRTHDSEHAFVGKNQSETSLNNNLQSICDTICLLNQLEH